MSGRSTACSVRTVSGIRTVTVSPTAHVRSIVDANERIGDLAGIARRLKERNERLEARVARLREAQGSTTLPSRVLRKIRG